MHALNIYEIDSRMTLLSWTWKILALEQVEYMIYRWPSLFAVLTIRGFYFATKFDN